MSTHDFDVTGPRMGRIRGTLDDIIVQTQTYFDSADTNGLMEGYLAILQSRLEMARDQADHILAEINKGRQR
jgi:hypothetical protein